MKTSTILLSLLVLNSSIIIAPLVSSLFANVNPLAMIGSEFLLVIGYYAFGIVREVRNAFDVKVTM